MTFTVFVTGVAVVSGVVLWPLLFTEAGLNGDGPLHLWLIWHQGQSIRESAHPSFFLNYSAGGLDRVFYPEYAFYGGTIYALAGALSLALGNSPKDAYILTYLLGFATAYGGWYWMARAAGLGRVPAHAPGLVFASSSYYLTLIYARGDWPEFIGVSMIPMMCAATLAIARAESLRLWPVLALVGSSLVFFGSHNLTILWGFTLLLVLGLVALALVPAARPLFTWSKTARVARLVIPSALVSGWFLVPTLTYSGSTLISHVYPWDRQLKASVRFVSPDHIFAVSGLFDGRPGARFALPVVAIVWVLACRCLGLGSTGNQSWSRILFVMLSLVVILTILMNVPGIILILPTIYTRLQFTYRLESYTVLGVSGAVLATMVLLKGLPGSRRRFWTAALVAVLGVLLAGAIRQVAAGAHAHGVKDLSSSFYETSMTLTDYLDVNYPAIEAAKLSKLIFTPTGVRGDRASAATRAAPGELVRTDIETNPSLLHVAGASIVGLAADGTDVLQIGGRPATLQLGGDRGRGGALTTVKLSPAISLPVDLGRVLSLCGGIALLLQLAALRLRGPRPRLARLSGGSRGAAQPDP